MFDPNKFIDQTTADQPTQNQNEAVEPEQVSSLPTTSEEESSDHEEFDHAALFGSEQQGDLPTTHKGESTTNPVVIPEETPLGTDGNKREEEDNAVAVTFAEDTKSENKDAPSPVMKNGNTDKNKSSWNCFACCFVGKSKEGEKQPLMAGGPEDMKAKIPSRP